MSFQKSLILLALSGVICGMAFAAASAAPSADVIFEEETVPPLPVEEETLQTPKIDEDFSDYLFSRGWEKKTIVGHYQYEYYILDRNYVSFVYPSYKVFGYIFNVENIFNDVVVEAKVRNMRAKTASYSLVCRSGVNGWYELRIQIAGRNSGTWRILRYDPLISADQGDAYVSIHPDIESFASKDLFMGVNRVNKIRFSCVGNQFHVRINDQEQVTDNPLSDDTLTRGIVGFGAQSYGDSSVQIDFTRFTAVEP